ncbi:phosphatidylserine decarboxylase family protein [bacterium (candidate division B38) B3_B38]|nr:MAG: phosphatidylserine decarboxylase family protein [bacterium (candidate division B38) B3_B38]
MEPKGETIRNMQRRKYISIRIAREGYPYILIPLMVALFLFIYGSPIPASLLLLVSGGMGFFFRDPPRTIPGEAKAIVSPADGRVMKIAPLTTPEGERRVLVSIFLSLFDAHINRAPVRGKIIKVNHQPGRFHPAFKEKASRVNERNIIIISNQETSIILHQIAGILARRAILWKKEGDSLLKGERIGIIRFGSRVDLWLPPEVKITIHPGQKVKAGSSIIGRLR